MRIEKIILMGTLVGVFSGILDGYEQDYGLNHITSAIILTLLTITTGYIIHKFGSNKINS